MDILVVGGGGREHALVWALKRSASVDRIYCTPGNAGIAGLAECWDIVPGDLHGIARRFGTEMMRQFFDESVASVETAQALLDARSADVLVVTARSEASKGTEGVSLFLIREGEIKVRTRLAAAD